MVKRVGAQSDGARGRFRDALHVDSVGFLAAQAMGGGTEYDDDSSDDDDLSDTDQDLPIGVVFPLALSRRARSLSSPPHPLPHEH